MNAGSIRIAGITDEDFIRIWNYRVSIVLENRTCLSPIVRTGVSVFRAKIELLSFS